MRALVLSGGADKGAYQVGVLKKWMYEDGVDYDILAGVSVGAINAAYLCQLPPGNPVEAWSVLRDLWSQVSNAKVRKNWFLFRELAALWKQSVYNSEPLQRWIKGGLDDRRIASSGKHLRIVAVSWDSGEAKTITEADSNIADWVIASSSFPVMLSPIRINDQLWTDGGVRRVTPLGEAIKAGATEIDVIICSDPYAPDPYDSKGKAAIPSLALRVMDLMSDEIMRADLKICGLKNDIAILNGKYKNIKIRIISPSFPLNTSITQDLDFSQSTINRMINVGYADACKLI